MASRPPPNQESTVLQVFVFKDGRFFGTECFAQSHIILGRSPEVDLQLALDMARAGGNIPDVPAWMLDDDMRLELTGAAAPAIAVSDSSDMGVVHVVEGVLRLSSSARDLLIEVSAGECLWADDSSATTSTEGDVADDDWHPMDDLLSGLCPQ